MNRILNAKMQMIKIHFPYLTLMLISTLMEIARLIFFSRELTFKTQPKLITMKYTFKSNSTGSKSIALPNKILLNFCSHKIWRKFLLLTSSI